MLSLCWQEELDPALEAWVLPMPDLGLRPLNQKLRSGEARECATIFMRRWAFGKGGPSWFRSRQCRIFEVVQTNCSFFFATTYYLLGLQRDLLEISGLQGSG